MQFSLSYLSELAQDRGPHTNQMLTIHRGVRGMGVELNTTTKKASFSVTKASMEPSIKKLKKLGFSRVFIYIQSYTVPYEIYHDTSRCH